VKSTSKFSRVAGAALFAGFVAASSASSATLIDFTDSTVGVGPGPNWVLTGDPVAPNTNEAGPGPVGVLVGDNDGVGVIDDEITFGKESVTLTFDREVRLTAAYFLDLFIAADKSTKEIANITVGDIVGLSDASLVATAELGVPGKKIGYGELLGVNLRGSQFTFWASETNDMEGRPDFALAAVEISPVPLPAGALLLLTGLAGLGIARRRRG
jgi:hypothetical protein